MPEVTITAAQPELVELRCPNDGKLLLKVSDISGVVIQVKCRGCGELLEAGRVEN